MAFSIVQSALCDKPYLCTLIPTITMIRPPAFGLHLINTNYNERLLADLFREQGCSLGNWILNKHGGMVKWPGPLHR